MDEKNRGLGFPVLFSQRITLAYCTNSHLLDEQIVKTVVRVCSCISAENPYVTL